MPGCEVQRGFLALRRCGDRAVAPCAVCQRAACAEHLVGDRCPDCADAAADWRTDPSGPARYRRTFYGEDGWMGDEVLYWGYERYGFDSGPSWDDDAGATSGWDS